MDVIDIDFTDSGFWVKLTKFARKAGCEVVEKALWLYYAAQSPGTPVWAKGVIYGALAYLICPLDAVPDIVPIVGYSDDLGALGAAIVTVATYITPEVREKAAAKLNAWFA